MNAVVCVSFLSYALHFIMVINIIIVISQSLRFIKPIFHKYFKFNLFKTLFILREEIKQEDTAGVAKKIQEDGYKSSTG